MTSDPVRQARRIPNTARGQAMRKALLTAGQESFLSHGYHGTSVAGICQQAHVSNGAFYQYFPDKEALFLALWSDFQELLFSDLHKAASQGRGLKGRVEVAAAALMERLHEQRGLLQVYREAEFVAGSLARTFWEKLENELPVLLGITGVDPGALACFVLGAVYFNLVSRSQWGIDHHPLPTILDFLLRGMAPAGADPRLWRLPAGAHPAEAGKARGKARAAEDTEPLPDAAPGKTGKAEQTRRRLVEAAEQLFGTIGYHGCATSKVSESAGVAQGTFFRYFPTKAALLDELVRQTNRRLKGTVARATAGAGHRLRAEALSTRAFLSFIGGHREMYRVVREAEFAERELGRWYYLDLAESYRVLIEPAISAGEVRPLDPFALVLSVMGIGHHLGLRWPVWEQVAVPPRALEDSLDLMMLGVLGVAGERGEG